LIYAYLLFHRLSRFSPIPSPVALFHFLPALESDSVRGCPLLLTTALLLPAAASAQETRNAEADGWRPTVQHSTIDRSQFPDPAAVIADPPWHNDVTKAAQPIETFADDLGTAIQPIHQSPEIGTIESPLQPEPGAIMPFSDASSFIDGSFIIDPRFDESQSWVTIKSSRLSATWLPGGNDQIGLTDFAISTSLAIPTLDSVTITPGFQLHFVDGPTRTDLPEQLYNAQVEFRWKKQVSRPFWFELALKPGIYSDLDRQNSDAFRLIGQGLAFFAFSYQTQAVVGLTYLDRFDINYLPVFGIIYSPRQDIKLNMVFPAPKLAFRLSQGPADELWGYVAGEFGGGSWAVGRSVGRAVGRGRRRVVPAVLRKDVIAYTDWRLMFGLEQKETDGGTMFVEVGYVFNRELEYKSGLGDFDPDSTAMLRAGLTY
jgi:hypothetical protein